jgi:oligopeptide/dipeptide ABC transporter ATP-binding protein
LPSADPLLAIQDLTVTFRQRRASVLRAVDDVSFEVAEGETVAVLGESGSGKSTIGNAILGLAPVSSGALKFRGQDLAGPQAVDRAYRSEHIQVVFQDPYGSLNPSRTIGETLAEPLMVHRKMTKPDMREAVLEMLRQVGLPPDSSGRFPANFSGGQRQRIAIARAMITAPDLVVCDEPVSGLDLSVQAQVLNLLTELQQSQRLAYLFISHDIAVVRHIAHRVVVLYSGRIVESGSVAEVCDDPRHPYTRALFLAAPVANPAEQRIRRASRLRWAKDATSATTAPPAGMGCPFSARCPFTIERCLEERPELRPTNSGSMAACHREEQIPDLAIEFGRSPELHS